MVKKQIARLSEPSIKCVELVIAELTNLIHKITEKLNRFPMLREQVELILASKIKETEQGCKDQLVLYTNVQLSYINTNHEEFIGFGAALQNQTAEVKSKVSNQIIRKGYLGFHTGGIMKGSKEFWFVLTTETLSWYKDDSEKEKKYMMPLDGLKLKDIESGIFSKRFAFALFNVEGHNAFKEYREMELSCESQEHVDSWKASFLRAGVYPEKTKLVTKESEETDKQTKNDIGTYNPQLERQVEIIRNLVDSYLRIVNKSTRDFVPKIIMHLIINNLREFVKNEIVAHVYSSNDQASLLDENPEEIRKRDEILKVYNSTKEALKIIGDVAKDNIQDLPITRQQQSQPMIQQQNIYNNRPQSQMQPGPRSPPTVPMGGQQPTRPPPVNRPAPQPGNSPEHQQQQQYAQQNQNINFSVNPTNLASGYNTLTSLASMTGNNLPQMSSSVTQQLPDQNFNISVNPATIANGISATASLANSLTNNPMFSGGQMPMIPKRPTNENS